jgi:REP element-mobilizing transposase RayT
VRHLPRRGGKRAGAGRKPKGARAGVPHRPRPVIKRKTPVHVTVRLVPEVGSLRRRKLIAAMREAFRRGKVKNGFRICQFSIQRNHMHLVSEAESNRDLAKGVQAWEIRVARRVNARLGRQGKVFADRFHAVPVRSPRQLRNTLCYVMNNGHRHGELHDPRWGGIDLFSSAWHFTGWAHDRWRRGLDPPTGEPPVAPAETWLLTEGWLKWGKVGVGEVPRAAGPRAITREEWLGEPA